MRTGMAHDSGFRRVALQLCMPVIGRRISVQLGLAAYWKGARDEPAYPSDRIPLFMSIQPPTKSSPVQLGALA